MVTVRHVCYVATSSKGRHANLAEEVGILGRMHVKFACMHVAFTLVSSILLQLTLASSELTNEF
jgi:hypothetical protein